MRVTYVVNPDDVCSDDGVNPAPGEAQEDPATMLRLRAADGLLDLGDPPAALRELERAFPVTESVRSAATSVRVKIAAMTDGPRASGPLAIEAAYKERPHLKVVEDAVIEALNLGGAAQVLRLKERWDELGGPECSGVWHNTAAAHVMLRQFDAAIVAVYHALHLPNSDVEWCLLDAHHSPLWHHLADGPVSFYGERLRGWRGLPVLAAYVETQRGLRPVCWHTAHLLLPEMVTRWMRRDRNMMLKLNPSAPVQIQRRLREWLRNRRHRMTRVLRKAIQGGGQTHGLGSELGTPESPEPSPHHGPGDDWSEQMSHRNNVD